MFCPKCRGEFRDGFSVCNDCGETLVGQLPQEQLPSIFDFGDEVELLVTADVNLFREVRAALDAVGIQYYSTGDDATVYGHYHSHVGMNCLFVKKADEAAAIHAARRAGFGAKE